MNPFIKHLLKSSMIYLIGILNLSLTSNLFIKGVIYIL